MAQREGFFSAAASGRAGAKAALWPLLRPAHRIPLSAFCQQKSTHKGCYFVGAERGIRTLDTIPSIHDFQSCALDQLSHLCKVRWV